MFNIQTKKLNITYKYNKSVLKLSFYKRYKSQQQLINICVCSYKKILAMNHKTRLATITQIQV